MVRGGKLYDLYGAMTPYPVLLDDCYSCMGSGIYGVRVGRFSDASYVCPDCRGSGVRVSAADWNEMYKARQSNTFPPPPSLLRKKKTVTYTD